MKIKIIAFLLSLNLIGCVDVSTDLEKNVVNLAYDSCKEYLSNSLVSPSMTLNSVSVHGTNASIKEVYDAFGSTIISNGKIEDYELDEKIRFRVLAVNIIYSSENSFGVNRKGSVTCRFTYKIGESSPNPSSLTLTMFRTGMDAIYPNILINDFDKVSNIFLNSEIDSISSNTKYNYNKEDQNFLNDLIKYHKASNIY